MKNLRMFAAATAAALSLAAFNASATIDPAASVVQLRTSCDDGSGGELDNCFTYVPDLTAWLKNTRLPSADSPLEVHIGQGTWSASGSGFQLICQPSIGYTGHIAFKGAGRDHSIFTAGVGLALLVKDCDNLSFRDLTLRATGDSGGAVSWRGGGHSNWSGVDIDGKYYAWNEKCGATPGKHYWFGSRIVGRDSFANNTTAYAAPCDESWFFGSEITVSVDCPLAAIPQVSPAALTVGKAEVHVYGSVIRSLASCPMATNGALRAAVTYGTGALHIHGTGIDVISTVPNNIIALSADSDTTIHANTSAYNLSTASGTVTRVSGAGHIHAPYQWEPHTTPPNIISQDGADTAVVTSSAGGTPRMVIYSTACASKWFDVGANACQP